MDIPVGLPTSSLNTSSTSQLPAQSSSNFAVYCWSMNTSDFHLRAFVWDALPSDISVAHSFTSFAHCPGNCLSMRLNSLSFYEKLQPTPSPYRHLFPMPYSALFFHSISILEHTKQFTYLCFIFFRLLHQAFNSMTAESSVCSVHGCILGIQKMACSTAGAQ